MEAFLNYQIEAVLVFWVSHDGDVADVQVTEGARGCHLVDAALARLRGRAHSFAAPVALVATAEAAASAGARQGREPLFALLRWAVTGKGPLPGVAEDVLDSLRDIRAEYLRVTADLDAKYVPNQDNSGAERILPLFVRIWHKLQPLHEHHALGLPPIYKGNAMLDHLLLSLIRSYRARESLPDHVFDHSHAVIGGVEGTGKTTIVKALAIAVAVCSDRFFLAYADMKRAECGKHWLKHFAQELLARMQTRDFNSDLVFETDLKLGADRCFNCIAKMPVWQCRVGLVADEFQEIMTAGAPLEDARIQMYRDIQAFAKTQQGTLLIITGSSANLRSLLFDSHRTVASPYSSYPDFNKPLCLDSKDTFFLFPQIIRMYSSRAPELEAAISEWKAGRTGFLEPGVLRVPIDDFRGHMCALGLGDTCDDWLSKWVDRGLVYIAFDNTGTAIAVEITRPADAETYFRDAPAPADYFMVQAIVMKFVFNVNINIGTGCEELLRPRVHIHLPNNQWRYTKDRVFVIASTGEVEIAAGGGFCETGLDGLQFEVIAVAAGGFHVVVHGWQLKVGQMDIPLGGGSPQTHRSKVLASGTVEKIGDSTVFEITTKAEFGLKAADNARVSMTYKVKLLNGLSWLTSCLEPQLATLIKQK
eukprot:m51a1_g4878 hypothetical protein (646) ;mRNA; r:2558-10778